MELAIYIGILSAILWFGIGRHEYKSLRRVIDTLDYIEKNRELYIRVGGALIKKPDLEKEGMFENTFESKMLSVDDEHVFVCYAPHTFGESRLKSVRDRATSILNSFTPVWTPDSKE